MMKTRLHVQANIAPSLSVSVARRKLLQRKCACGGEPGQTNECESCRKKKLQGRSENLDRSSISYPPSSVSEVPPIVHEVLRSPGQPLDAQTRAFMEPRFGHDFSRVRVHTDHDAAESARLVNAKAYAAGHNIVFAAGRYHPEASSGKELLAHELTHTIQQDAAEGGINPRLETSRPGDPTEQEAEVAAALVTQTQATSVTNSTATQVARQESDEKPPDGGASAAAPPAASSAVTIVEEAKTPDATCALTTYTGSNLVGETVTADAEFVDSLDKINKHASDNNVDLYVTSSFRTSTDVPGAIVTPAKMSNHLAGHAIDMNVKYGDKKNKLCNSTCLGGTLPVGVAEFIKAIQDDAELRWGGDFADKDPVHIDDNLNADTEAWKKRKEATQAARKSGCG
jgi:hypothetical protein